MNTFQKSAAAWNKLFMALMKAPVLDKAIGRSTGILTYTGRKSGKKFSLPVSYSQSGETLTVWVMMPEKKNWWRNFSGDGDRVGFTIAGVDRQGHAVTARDDKGRVSVTIGLDPASS